MFTSAGITELLIDWSEGNEKAQENLFPLVEKELHRMARFYIRRINPGNTLQTTAVINETYLKLVDQNKVQWQNRAHFFGIAAKMMRRFLLNYIRDTRTQKRGGKFVQVAIEDALVITNEKSNEILALEEALCRLAATDARKARVVELRYFGGLSIAEIAVVLQIAEITVMRDWNFAKAWLAQQIRNGS